MAPEIDGYANHDDSLPDAGGVRAGVLQLWSAGRSARGTQPRTPRAGWPPIPPRNDSLLRQCWPSRQLDIDAVLTQLTREVRKWIVRHQRPPKNFEEFAASATVPIPPRRRAKNFALGKPMRVIVVNR